MQLNRFKCIDNIYFHKHHIAFPVEMYLHSSHDITYWSELITKNSIQAATDGRISKRFILGLNQIKTIFLYLWNICIDNNEKIHYKYYKKSTYFHQTIYGLS